MNLPEEAKKQLNEVYGNLAEEIRILYRALKIEGFSHEDAMSLVICMLSRPQSLDDCYGRNTYSRTKKMELIRKYINDRKNREAEVAKENV